jgi:acylphosphatase
MSAAQKEQESAGEAKEAFYAFVRGRVQGVGFRQFVWTRARALGLSGYVRNGPDGYSVEVTAEGSTEALNRLLNHLHRGPFMARVDKVDVEWQDEGGRFLSFEVRF